MDKIELLKARRAEILEAGSEIRKKIAELTDEASFAEFDSYSFSENEFYEGTVGGEGVICGSATINDNAVYVIAQNGNVLAGGITDANCKKIVKCQQKALRAGAPVIYLLDTKGVAVGEGVSALEGIGEVLAMAQELKGECVQIAVATGEVLGSFALLAASCDFTFMTKNACVAYASPLVISAASGKNLAKEEVGGVKNNKNSGATTFEVEDILAVRDTVTKLLDTLPAFNGEVETMDDFNRAAPELNQKVCVNCLKEAVFDKDYFIEMNKGFADEVVTGIARIGGMAVGAVIFGGGDKGVELDRNNVAKVKEFLYFCDESGLPVVTFVNTLGVKANLATAQSPVMKEIANLTYALYNLGTPRINVVYGKAVGLGYSLFASKALGAEYSYAFATAKISLFDTKAGAMIELAGISEENKDKAEEKYADEIQDPVNAARKGYIDDIIEPQFVRAYLISALQLVTR
ncbi:MAG: hypothetical protein IJW13_06040 [Clostridia bacterium]|nr:hypothetical protein [Clostridia bacterium]